MSNLKSCSDCGHKVSTSARTCPNCGKHFPFEIPTPVGIVLALGIVTLLCSLILQPSETERRFQNAAKLAHQAACESGDGSNESCH